MARLADAGRAEDLPQYRFISHPELPRVHRAPGFLRRVWPESLMEVKVCILGPVIASMLGKPTPPQRWEARQVDRQCVQGASPKKIRRHTRRISGMPPFLIPSPAGCPC